MPSETLLETKQDDLLNRQEFVDKMITVSEILSRNKKNVCYALNGSWGVGKSFVLDMFESQISQFQTSETTMGKYLVFHYNCWKYDYYEEPLVAIVSTILDTIDKNVQLFSSEKRATIKSVLKKIGEALLTKASSYIEEKTGINPSEMIGTVKSINDSTQTEVDKQHEYDPYFDFKKILDELRSTINSLAVDQTLIFVVDELDRCLPEYTIKVLERLHHIFDEITNVQVILSIDKTQLQHTIKQIYGSETRAEKYLAKFIDFEIKLTPGSFNDNFQIQFSEYLKCFTYHYRATKPDDTNEFLTKIREGIDIRSSIAIFEKSNLLHTLLCPPGAVNDYSILCIEVFLTLLKFYDIDIKKAKENFGIQNLFEAAQTFRYSEQTLPGLMILREKYRKAEESGLRYLTKENARTYIRTDDIWGLLLGCYRIILGYTNDYWERSDYSASQVMRFVRSFWQLLKFIN